MEFSASPRYRVSNPDYAYNRISTVPTIATNSFYQDRGAVILPVLLAFTREWGNHDGRGPSFGMRQKHVALEARGDTAVLNDIRRIFARRSSSCMGAKAELRQADRAAQGICRVLVILFALGGQVLAAAGSSDKKAYFVAVNGRDAWSGTLDAPNATGSDGPFATLAAAQAAMRATRNRTTYVRAGSYFATRPLSLTEADSGSRILAFPGEQPVLYGGLPVSEWLPNDDGLRARAPTAPVTESSLPILFAAERMVPISRFPPAEPRRDAEAGWLFADSAPDGTDPHRTFRVRAQDMHVFARIKPGTFVTIFGQRGWQNFVIPIQAVDQAQRLVTLAGASWDALGEGSPFALLNGEPAPGEWRIDRVSNALEIGPSNAAWPRQVIVPATLPCTVEIVGGRNILISGLRFVGSATEGAAICLSSTQDVTLDGLGIFSSGDGIRMDSAAGTLIRGSEIAGTARFGIVLRHHSDQTVVRGNWLHDIGWLQQDASAIWFDGSSRNRFVQNLTLPRMCPRS